MKDTKQKLTGIKEVDDLEVRIKNLKEIFSNLRNRKLKQKDEFPDEMDMEKDEVVFKIHTKGHFEYDPLRYINGSVSCVSAFIYDKDVFPRCLNHIMSEIDEHKWVAHKKQHLGKYYYKNLKWEEDDAGLRCCSSTPFDTRYKRKINKSKKTGVIHDEGAGRKRKKSLVNKGNKGKEKVFEDEGNQGVVTIYKRAMVNGKAKMVEVEGAVKTGRDIGVVTRGKEEVVKVHQLSWWSLNDGFVCLSTSILCSSTKAFGICAPGCFMLDSFKIKNRCIWVVGIQ
ncbi:hypothetical protein Tco_0360137, partial [Tanacetum coccineum]